jgi:hypothetical protein
LTWRDLITDPPTGKEYAVLLFPCKTDCGILYVTSNPQYAIVNAAKQGYTHWCEFKLAPTHDQWQEWQDKINEE